MAKLPQLSRPSNRVSNAVRTWYALQRQKRRQKRRRADEAAGAVMRYFVRQHERLIADHKEARDSYQESLRVVVAEQSAANAKLIVCLDNNTKVLQECRDEMRLVRMERKQV